MLTEVIFDVETQKLFSDLDGHDPAGLGVSIVSAYIRQLDDTLKEVSGTMQSLWENELDRLWPVFRSAHRIIGFNTLKFDIPVLKPYAPQALNLARLPHLDIMTFVRSALGHNLSLDTLARETLGRGKTDHGTNAVEYFASRDPASLAKLKSYCEADVLLTRDLYDYGLSHGLLKFVDKWNSKRTFTVDFSYPKAVKDAAKQIGLF